MNDFKVVIDTAEWGIKLIQDFNFCLTKDEEQRHFLLQVVSNIGKFILPLKKSPYRSHYYTTLI